MKIAVYTIALNEEQFVKRWADSARDADYLFLLDTGSTDNTLLEAAANNVEVFQAFVRPWRFDDARNVALSLLPDDIDICIALDMDEVLVDGWREKLEKINPKTTRPRYKYTWSWNGDQPGLQYGGDKIHRRHGYRWKHPVHEVLVADRTQEVQEWIDLEIHHFPDNSKSRGQYMPLLKLSVEEDPWDDRNAYYYARELYFAGQYADAAVEFKRHLSLPKATWGPERAASCRYLAKSEPASAEGWLLQAVKEAPGRREPLVELATLFYNQGRWALCWEYAKKALDVKEKPLDYLCEDFAWGALPHDLAAIASYHLKDKRAALKHGKEALKLDPTNERLQRNLEFYKSQ